MFVNTNNKLSEKEIKKTVLFQKTSKRVKYLEINLTKEVKELYTKSNKVLMEESGKDTNKKMSQVYGLE